MRPQCGKHLRFYGAEGFDEHVFWGPILRFGAITMLHDDQFRIVQIKMDDVGTTAAGMIGYRRTWQASSIVHCASVPNSVTMRLYLAVHF